MLLLLFHSSSTTVTGTIAVTLEACTASARGNVSTSGTISALLGDAVCAATGTVFTPPAVGVISSTLSPCASSIEGWVGQRPVFRVETLTYTRVTAFARASEGPLTRPMPKSSIALYRPEDNVLARPKQNSEFIFEVVQ